MKHEFGQMFKISALVLGLLFAATPSQAAVWKEFHHPEYGYALQYPADWKVNDAGVVVFSAPKNDPEDKNRDRVMVMYFNYSQKPTTLDKFVKEFLRGTEKGKDYKHVERGPARVAGIDAAYEVYTYTQESKISSVKRSVPRKCKDYLLIKDGKRGFVISYHATPGSYELHLAEAERIVNSFAVR